jgi:hypothetical protein
LLLGRLASRVMNVVPEIQMSGVKEVQRVRQMIEIEVGGREVVDRLRMERRADVG